MGDSAARSGRAAHVAWGVGSTGTIAYINTVTALGLIFLTMVLGIEPAVAGTMMTAARVFDAFSDPAMGYLTDRTHSRWGRRRPWLLLGALVCGAMLASFYNAPRLESAAETASVAMLLLVGYSLGFTIFNVPYMTMPVEMSRDHQERISIMSYRVIFMSLGTYLGSSVAPALLDVLGRDARGFSWIGLIFGTVVLLAMLTAFVGTARVPLSEFKAPHLPLREQIRTALSNRPFALLMGAKVLQFIGIAANSGTLAYVVTTVLKRGLREMFVYGTVFMLAIFVSVPIWRRIARNMPKRRGFIIGTIAHILMTMTWLAAHPGEPEIFVPLRAIGQALFVAPILLFGQAVWIDAVDYDYRRTGLRREGLFTSVYVFVERLGYSLAPMILGLLLQWFQFDRKLPLEQQPPSAATAVMVSLVGVPVVTFALSLIFLAKYDLTEEKLDATRPPGVTT